MKQWQLPVFSAIVFPLKCTFFSPISSLISLHITSVTLFIFRIFFIAAVSDADIHAVNSYKILYAVVKRERDDGTGGVDLVIE